MNNNECGNTSKIKNNSNNQKMVPIHSYPNAHLFKAKILKDNNNKSGIYRWINNINNKSYIGSAKCLKNRLSIYFSSTTLKNRLERGSSAIHSALLKYSYNNFKLEIIEYCEQDLLISREQYYINMLKPEYNICKIAGLTLGKRHSESTKQKIRNSTTGKNHYLFGKHRTYEMPIETKLKLSLVSIGLNVKVFDLENNLIKEFPSINRAAKYFDVSSTTINKAIKKGRRYLNFLFKSEIKDNRI